MSSLYKPLSMNLTAHAPVGIGPRAIYKRCRSMVCAQRMMNTTSFIQEEASVDDNPEKKTSNSVNVAKMLRNCELPMFRPTISGSVRPIVQSWLRMRAQLRLFAFRAKIDPNFCTDTFKKGAIESYKCIHDLARRKDFISVSTIAGDRVLRALLQSKSECETAYGGLSYEIVDVIRAKIINVEFEELHDRNNVHKKGQCQQLYALIDVQLSVLERMTCEDTKASGRLHRNDYVHMNQRAIRLERPLLAKGGQAQWKVVDFIRPHIPANAQRRRYYYRSEEQEKNASKTNVKKRGVYAEPL